jgi:hypothetical protein
MGSLAAAWVDANPLLTELIPGLRCFCGRPPYSFTVLVSTADDGLRT